MLDHGQRIAALILFAIALTAWLVVAIRWQPGAIPPSDPYWAEADSLRHLSDSLRRDSLRRVREARWEQKKDSFRRVDDARFARWAQERQLRYDSARLADSLWRDSVGFRFPKRIKKDTILNLNRCDTAELQLIRGIGPYAAKRIASYREQLGGFYSLDQLSDSTLAPLHIDTLVSHFFINPEDVRTMPVNRSSIQALQQHPYLRFQQAKAVYNLRRQKIRLRSLDDLRTLNEFSEQELERLAPYLSFE